MCLTVRCFSLLWILIEVRYAHWDGRKVEKNTVTGIYIQGADDKLGQFLDQDI